MLIGYIPDLRKSRTGGSQDLQDSEVIENVQQRISELEEQIAATRRDKEEKENQVVTLKQKSTELEIRREKPCRPSRAV